MTEKSKALWWQSMIDKHGSEQAVRDFMAESARKKTPTGTGGFHYMAKHQPDKHKQISRIGGSIGRRTKKLET